MVKYTMPWTKNILLNKWNTSNSDIRGQEQAWTNNRVPLKKTKRIRKGKEKSQCEGPNTISTTATFHAIKLWGKNIQENTRSIHVQVIRRS